MKVAVVGTGVIGASWTTLFLAHGHEVVATDPAPGAEDRLRAAVTADQTRLTFTPDLAEAVADAGFVQENG
ncbi:3-hydroxyacyl-CoA dehydrogenase NAD-binding domain-containing protein, partial [Streptomyces narbonensis]